MANSYTRAAAHAIADAVDTEHSFPEWLATVLAAVAAQRGNSYDLIAGRPGSWEASLVNDLVTGTVGPGDEYLADYRHIAIELGLLNEGEAQT